MMAENSASSAMPASASAKDILHAALSLADEKGWDNIRLYQVADQLDISLEDVRHHYADLNGVANAWFKLAQLHMISPPDGAFIEQPAWRRLYLTMVKWLEHVSQHPKVTAQIIRAKLHPPHVHHWVPMIFDLSTLIHWWLDAARIASVGRKRQMAEVGLTAIFLGTLAYWTRDKSPGHKKTRAFLKKRLRRADRTMRLCSRC